MKKIIIAAAIVCAAVVSQAAAVGWTCMGANAFANGKYGVYVIGLKGVTSVTQIQALVAEGGLAAASAYEFGNGTTTSAGVATVAATKSGKSITYSGSGTDTYQGVIFFESTDGKMASYTSLASFTMDNDSTSKAFGFANQSANLTANKFNVSTEDVPEPTSGLLLLLGVAGLALRRKQK